MNKNILKYLSKIGIATVAFSILSTATVFAADGDIWNITTNKDIGGIGKLLLNTDKTNLFGLISNMANYGYEFGGNIYNAGQVNSSFNSNPTETPSQAIVGASLTSAASLAVSSVSATSNTTISLTFNNTIQDADKSALTFTFNGVTVPSSNVTYSGSTATLTGLTLVASTDGKTPAYELDVMSGTTELSKQSVVLKNILISKVSAVPDVSVAQNAQPVLPSTVSVTYKDGSTGTVAVTWGSVVTSTVGTTKVVGKIAGTTLTAAINVNVTAVQYVNTISVTDYSTLGIYLVSVQADSSVASMSINGSNMYYEGKDNFQFATVLTKGSTITFIAYDSTGKQLQKTTYLVQQ